MQTQKPSTKRLNLELVSDQHRQLKILAATTGQTISDLVRDLVKRKLSENAHAA